MVTILILITCIYLAVNTSNPCGTNPCQNSGVCAQWSTGGGNYGYNCTCPAGWEGQHCETSKSIFFSNLFFFQICPTGAGGAGLEEITNKVISVKYLKQSVDALFCFYVLFLN